MQTKKANIRLVLRRPDPRHILWRNFTRLNKVFTQREGHTSENPYRKHEKTYRKKKNSTYLKKILEEKQNGKVINKSLGNIKPFLFLFILFFPVQTILVTHAKWKKSTKDNLNLHNTKKRNIHHATQTRSLEGLVESCDPAMSLLPLA